MSDHGYYGTYSNGCRCSACKAAKAEYMRERRKAARERSALNTDDSAEYIADGITHGTAHAYKDNGCRCSACREAASAKRLAEYQRAAKRQRLGDEAKS